MPLCASVKKKGSIDRCGAKTLLNSDFCGRHARMSNPVRWDTTPDAAKRIRHITTLQSLARRLLVKRLIRWAGPGAMHRKECVNDEEMVTFEDKAGVSPLEYFGWEENGKTWWMSQLSALQLLREDLRPVNPYTKVPWSLETRKRLRHLQCFRLRRKLPLFHSPPSPGTQTQLYVRTICQTMEEQSMEELHPNHWNAMSTYQQLAFLEILCRMLNGWALETPVRPWRVSFASHTRRMYQSIRQDPGLTRWGVARCVNTLVFQDREIPDLMFLVTSARYQALLR